ncbi:MAG: DUF2316 family protein [Enterococcus sp.]
MSLTAQQMRNTRNELQENFARTGLTIEQLATALDTTTTVITDTLALDVTHIEDPWILKNYLEDTLHKQGKTAITFTALVGDYHQHWFLDKQRIEQQKIG